jgi:GNAT superfamily N-acetyltransferase
MNIAENPVIRLAGIEDLDFISASQVNMALETEQMHLDRATVSLGVNAVFSDPQKGFYCIAEMGKERAGCLLITPEWSDWRNAWIWWIQSVYVKPDYRKSGVFSAMYNYIKLLVVQRADVSGIRLYVDNTNSSAREVYTRIGMNGEHYRTFEWIKQK